MSSCDNTEAVVKVIAIILAVAVLVGLGLWVLSSDDQKSSFLVSRLYTFRMRKATLLGFLR
jgi:hypothetical protein